MFLQEQNYPNTKSGGLCSSGEIKILQLKKVKTNNHFKADAPYFI